MIERDDLDLQLAAFFADEAPRAIPAGLDARVSAAIAATGRRTAWLTRERWTGRPARAGAQLLRRSAIVAFAILLLAAILAAAWSIGSIHRPAPFGLARAGLIAVGVASADGTTGSVELVAPDGRRVRSIAAPGLVAHTGRWSPDGATLAFWQQADGGPVSLVTVDANGNALAIVAGPFAAGGTIAWASDSRRIAFDATSNNRQRIYVATAGVPGATQVGDPSLAGSDPAWSPDGSHIAFRGGVGGNLGDLGIFVMDSDGTVVHRISHGSAQTTFDYAEPAWSPDGRTIATLITDRGDYDIVLVSVAGSPDTIISTSPADDVAARWSPDGGHVAWLEGAGSGPGADAGFRLVVAAADGSDPHVLAGPLLDDHDPTWAPDAASVIGYLPRIEGQFTGDDDQLILERLDGAPATTIAMDGRISDAADWQRLAP